jgi:hypothetical protein
MDTNEPNDMGRLQDTMDLCRERCAQHGIAFRVAACVPTS